MKKLFLLLATLPLFWLGCSSGPYLPDSDPQSPEAVGKKVVLFDEDMEDDIAVDRGPVAQRNEAGLLQVQVALRNKTDKSIQVQAQVLFKDANGMVLYNEAGSETPWQALTLSPNETKTFSQTALTAQASQYGVRVRYMNRKNK